MTAKISDEGRMFRLMDLLYVFCGGAIGSALRYAIGLAPFAGGGFPWPTLLVNLAGSLALGYITGRSHVDGALPRPWMLFLGPGLCGGFTTYSAFAVETKSLLERHALPELFAYLALTVVGGMVMAFLGFMVARTTT